MAKIRLVVAALLAVLLAACSGSAVSGGGDAAGGDAASEPADGAGDAASAPSEGAASEAAGGEPIDVGLLIPTSGVYALLGEDIRNGFELYLEQNGGALGGRPVETVEVDEGEAAETGVRGAQRLVEEDQVDTVVGIVSSAVALGVRDLFDERQIPLILTNAGADDLTGAAASDYIFRTSFSNRQPNYAMGRWLAEEGVEDLFIIAPTTPRAASRPPGRARRTRRGRHGGRRGVPAVHDHAGLPAVPAADPRLRRAGGARLLLRRRGDRLRAAVPAVRAGRGDPAVRVGLPDRHDRAAPAGAAAEGIRTALHYAPALENPTNQAFVEAYTAAYDEPPTQYAVAAWDAAQLLDLALADFEGEIADDPEGFVTALEGVGEIDSPRGPFTLSDTHNPEQPFYLLEVAPGDDGQLTNIVVEELGSVEDPN